MSQAYLKLVSGNTIKKSSEAKVLGLGGAREGYASGP